MNECSSHALLRFNSPRKVKMDSSDMGTVSSWTIHDVTMFASTMMEKTPTCHALQWEITR